MSDSDSDWEQPVYVSKELQEQIDAELEKAFPEDTSVKRVSLIPNHEKEEKVRVEDSESD